MSLTNSSPNSNYLDLLEEYLNDDSSSLPKHPTVTDSTNNVSEKLETTDDILSWLEDSPPKENKLSSLTTLGSSRPSISLNLTPLSIPKSEPGSVTTATPTNNFAISNFFDEVFGQDDNSSTSNFQPSQVFKDEIYAAKETPFTTNTINIESEINSILDSTFPDIKKLRHILLSSGKMPPDLRGKVWCLLLNGFYVEDQEAHEFKSIEGSVERESEIRDDCEAIANSTIGSSYAPEDLSVCQRDLVDLIVLYCSRRETEYHHILSQILGPILVSPHRMPRGLAYSCFYSLCSKFIPLINLQDTAFTKAISKLSEWIRLLTIYHFPALAIHLDRVVPGWEIPSIITSALENRRISTQHASDAGLDQLEAELGYGFSGGNKQLSTDSISARNTKAPEIESARPNRVNNSDSAIGSGLISLNWICAFFAGSTPPEQTCVLWDWILLNDNRFAGVYLTASLLGIFSETLLTMTGSEIRLWMERVSTGSGEWYKLCTPPLGSETPYPNPYPYNWVTFTRGWMYATEAMKKNTPLSFVSAIDMTEEWASDVNACGDGNQDRDRDISVEGQGQGHGDLDEEFHDDNPNIPSSSSSSSPMLPTTTIVGQSAISSSESPSSTQQQQQQHPNPSSSSSSSSSSTTSTTTLGPNLTKLVDISTQGIDIARQKFKKFQEIAQTQSKYWINLGGPGGLSVFGPDEKAVPSSQKMHSESKWLHDKLNKSVCLWTEPAEVLPCLCSNRRKPVVDPNTSILSCYLYGLRLDSTSSDTSKDPSSEAITATAAAAAAAAINTDESNESSHTSSHKILFPNISHESDTSVLGKIEPPFYFGIDCRTEEEKILGRFPKAFSMNANFIVDSEEVSYLLETLQPLADTVHICIIGAGDEAVRDRARTELNSRKKSVWDWELDEREKEKTREKEEKEIERYVEEDIAKLNGAAIFFIKRCFSKVSILNGGFISAAKYLLSDENSLSMENALVDVNEATMYKLLSPTSKDRMINNFSSSINKDSVLSNSSSSSSSSNFSSFISSLGSKLQNTAAGNIAGGTGAPNQQPAEDDKKNLLGDISKKLSLFGSSILARPSPSSSGKINEMPQSSSSNDKNKQNNNKSSYTYSSSSSLSSNSTTSTSTSSLSFVIDGDDEDDENSSGHGDSSHGVSIQKSATEKRQALAMHRLSGIVKGEKIVISKDDLPGAILFPSFLVTNSSDSSNVEKSALVKADHRYLVITRERFIVLNSGGDGVGAEAMVESNNHLTELIKMTFRKKDPELITLFFVHTENTPSIFPNPEEIKESTTEPSVPSADTEKPNISLRPIQYRIGKRTEFVDALQKKMQRFK